MIDSSIQKDSGFFSNFGDFNAFLAFPKEIIKERDEVGSLYGGRDEMKRLCGWGNILLSAKDEKTLTRFMFSFCYTYFDVFRPHIRWGTSADQKVIDENPILREHYLGAVFGVRSIGRIGWDYTNQDSLRKDPSVWKKVEECAKEVGNPAPFCIPKCEQVLILLKQSALEKDVDLKIIYGWF